MTCCDGWFFPGTAELKIATFGPLINGIIRKRTMQVFDPTPNDFRKLSPAGDERFAVVRRNPRGKLVMMTLDKDVDWAC